MNALSHRAQHRQVRHDVEAAYLSGLDRKPTPDEYRIVRHDVAKGRRAEQRAARIAAGTDRATLRRARGAR